MENNKNIENIQKNKDITKFKELTPKESIDKTQYEYLNLLNKKLCLFKNDNKSDKSNGVKNEFK